MRINPDSGFVHFTNKVFDTMIITALLLAGAVPVVTFGPFWTAAQAALLAVQRGDCSSVLKTFFSSLRQNFRQALLLWFPTMLVGLVVAADIAVCCFFTGEGGTVRWVMIGLTAFCTFFYTGMSVYLFAGLAAFHVTNREALHNAWVWFTGNFTSAVLLAVLYFGIFAAVWLAWIWALPIVALCLYIQAGVLNRVFGFVSPKQPGADPEDRQIYYE